MSDFDSPYACDFTYTRCAEGKNKLGRILLVLVYVAFVGAFFGFCYWSRIIPLFAVCPIFLWMLIFFTWRYVSYDYYFEFRTGVLTVGLSRIRKKREIRTPKRSITVKEAASIYPIPSGKVKFSRAVRLYDFSGTKNSECRIAVVTERRGKEEIYILECTRPLAKLLSSYKSAELSELLNRL